MKVLIFLLMLLTPVLAKDGGTWKDVNPEIREWFQAVRMPDNPRISCCGEADAYEADLGDTVDGQDYAIITNNRGNYLPVGTRVAIPKYKIQNSFGNPTDHVIIFLGQDETVYCFIPKGGV